MDREALLKDIVWLGHSSLFIGGRRNIYIDPFNVGSDLPKADLILFTHPHFDHLSEDDIGKLCKDETVLIGPKDCVSRFHRAQVELKPDEAYDAPGLKIQAIPAYTPKIPYHPKERGWVGYWLNLDGRRVYHAGDTFLVPESLQLARLTDLAFIPVDGIYTMNPFQAMTLVEAVEPALAVPIHYGSVCGSKGVAASFVRQCAERGWKADFVPCAAKEREDLALPAEAPRAG